MTAGAATPLLRGLLCTAFFLSGLTGLVYEVVWLRLLGRTTGATGLAVSLVLTMFMAGLALGGWLGSRRADRTDPRAAAWIYGALELAVGLYACAFPVVLACLEPAQAAVYRACLHSPAAFAACTFLVSGIALLVPTTLMGASLPFLCRACVAGRGGVGAGLGLLYGLNTAGAALGAGLAGFWLIREIGVQGSLLSAAALNAAIGLACLAASGPRRSGRAALAALRAPAGPEEPAGPAPVRAVLLIVAVSGFCSMAYEVVWTRLLSLLIGPTTYSFTLVLIVFIAGLSAGSLACGRLADRSGRPLAWLAGLQVAGALSALAASQLLGGAQFFFAKLIQEHQDHFGRLQLLQGLAVAAFLLPTAFCMGGMFPVAVRAAAAAADAVGRTAGRVYAWNTVGALLGAAAAGLVLSTLLGKEASLSLLVAVQAASAGAVVLCAGLRPFPRLALLAPAAIAALLCLRYPRWDVVSLADGKYHRQSALQEDLERAGWVEALLHGGRFLAAHRSGHRLLYAGDGPGGFCCVVERTNYLGAPNRVLSISGKPDASSRVDRNTQVLSAHLPMLMRPGAKSVMVLGLASGQTAGEILRHPVERLDVLEISPQVVAASDRFADLNNGALRDPRTTLLVQDGRLHLRFTDRSYDVISSEPSNPWLAGLAELYTREFFQDVRTRLAPGGVFVQFMHAYQMDWPTFALVGRTITSVFPDAYLLQTGLGGSDLLFVCFRDRPALDDSVLARDLPFAARSPFMKVASPVTLHPLFLAANPGPLFGEGPLNTGDRPVLEYLAPLALHDSGAGVQRRLLEGVRPPAFAAGWRERLADPAARVELVEFLASLNTWPYGIASPDALEPGLLERYRAAVSAYAAENSVDSYPAIPAAERGPCLATQEARLREHLSLLRRDGGEPRLVAAVQGNLARILWATGRREEAVARFREVLACDPADVSSRFSLAIALDQTGREQEAEGLYRSLLSEERLPRRVLTHLGSRFLRLGQPDRAEPLLAQVLAERPEDDTVNTVFAELLRRRGERPAALRRVEEVLARSPRFVPAHELRLQILVDRGDLAAARRALELALPLDPANRTFAEIRERLQAGDGKRR